MPTTCCDAKGTDEVERATAGAVPVPLRAIVCGEVEALSVTVMDAESGPDVVGSKLAEMVQLVPTVRVAPQVVVSAKLEALAPPSVMPVMFKGAPPALPVSVRVSDWTALVVPTTCAGKVSDVSESVELGTTPAPVIEKVWGELGALSTMVIVPFSVVVATVGVKFTVMVQAAREASVAGQLLVSV